MTKAKTLRIKITSWFLCILVLVVAFLSPYPVFAAANASEAVASNRYTELNNINYYIQAADACNNTTSLDGVNFNLLYRDEKTTKTVQDYLSLNLPYSDGALQNTTLYNAYLEIQGQGKYDNGSIYCDQLEKNPVAYLAGLYNVNPIDIICGKNNQGGLLTIKQGFTSSYNYKEDSWPTGWPATSSGITNDCRASVERIQYFANNPNATIPQSNGTVFGVYISVNEDFSFADFFKDKTGDLTESKVAAGLLNADRYMNFTKACGATLSTKEDYENVKNNGADTSNYYEIYNNADGKTEYWIMPSNKDRKTYANGSLTNKSNTATCQEIATALAPNSADNANLLAAERDIKITECFNQSYTNYSKLNSVKTNANLIYKNAADNYPYDLASRVQTFIDDQIYPDLSGTLNIIKTKAESAGGGTAIDQFVAKSQEFVDFVSGYKEKIDAGEELSDDDKADLTSAIDTYKTNAEKFKTEVVDKINTTIDGLPNYIINNDADGYKASVGKDANVDVCPLNDKVSEAGNKISEITGGTINLDTFTPSNRDESGALNGGVTSSEDPCYNGDIEAMSWILCPTLKNTAKTSDGLFEIIKDWMGIKTDYYDRYDKDGNETGAYAAWESFRDIANVVIILILLVVIFSQLTGYGIDNYGIKKILPKLIAMAVLINLSFLACQVLVDLSNIVGDGLVGLLRDNIAGEGNDFSIAALFDGLLAAAAGIGSVAGTVITGVTLVASGDIGIIVIIGILVLIVVLVSVIMFFAMIAARMVIVVIFMALSPLAFACYILPNTQKIFKKWWEVFKGALMVYPICGALYGMSYVIKPIVFKGQLNFGMAMVGLIVSFLPWLAIPTLLKKVMSGLGVVGEKFMGVGNALRKGTRSGLDTAKSTEAYKRAQDRGTQRVMKGISAWSASRLEAQEDRALGERQRARMQKYREMQRNGTWDQATEAQKRDYDYMRNKIDSSKYALSNAQSARLAAANAKITQYRNTLDTDRTNARSDVAGYQVAQNQDKINQVVGQARAGYTVASQDVSRTKQQVTNRQNSDANTNFADAAYRNNLMGKTNYELGQAREGVMQYGQQYFKQGDTTYARQSDGSWVANDGSGNKLTAAEVRQHLANNNGSMVSYGQAMANKDAIARAQTYGQLGAYANNSTVGQAANAAIASSLNTSTDSLADTITSGDASVLQLRHDQATSNRNKIIGDAKANAEIKGLGYDTTLSVDAAKLAAQKQIGNIASQNLAAEDYLRKATAGIDGYNVRNDLENSILVGADKNINQTVSEVAEGKTGVTMKNATVEEQKLKNAKFVADTERDAYAGNIDKMDLTSDIASENVKNAATRRIYEEGIKNSTKTTAPNYETMRSGAEQRQRDVEVKEVLGALATSNGIQVNGKSVHGANNEELKQALIYFAQSGKAEDAPAMLAVVDQLKSKGKAGLDVLSEVIGTKGSSSFAPSTDPELQRLFINNLASDPKIKAQDVELFKHIVNSQQGQSNLYDFERGTKTGNIKTNYLGSMSNTAFKETFDANNAAMLKDKNVISAAYEALTNATVSDDLTQGRKAMLREFLNKSGYSLDDPNIKDKINNLFK